MTWDCSARGGPFRQQQDRTAPAGSVLYRDRERAQALHYVQPHSLPCLVTEMVGLMGFLISRLMVKRMEFAVMWGLCASQKQRGASFFLEQALLCLTGCLIGRALSVQAVGRTNLMALLSERE